MIYDDLTASIDRRRRTREQRWADIEAKKRMLAQASSLAEWHEIRYANPPREYPDSVNKRR